MGTQQQEAFNIDEYINQNAVPILRMIAGMTSLITISATSCVEKEDLIQEGFLIIWEKRHMYNQRITSFDRWASTVVYNRFIDIVRKDQTKKNAEFRKEDISDMLNYIPKGHSVQDEYEEGVDEAFYSALFKAFVNEKSTTVRIGLLGVWNVYSGVYNSDEMADNLGVTKVMLNSCISRARKRLRPYLKEYSQ